MDYTILYIAIVLAVALGLGFAVKVLKNKNIITNNNIDFVTEVLGVAVEFVIQLDLKNTTELKKVSDILALTNVYIKQADDDLTRDEIINYTISLCSKFNLELTPERITILEKAIDALLSKINSDNKLADIEEKEVTVIDTSDVVPAPVEEKDIVEEKTEVVNTDNIKKIESISADKINVDTIAFDISNLGSDYSEEVIENEKNTTETTEPAATTSKRKYTKKKTTTETK